VIDTHCHVHDPKFDVDRDAVIARAREAGVTAMVTVGENVGDSHAAIEVAARYGLAVAVGVHPHEARNAPAGLAEELRPLLHAPGVVALGETGLDYYYEHSSREVQAAVLRTQLRLAREERVPVVFHQRDAFEDFTAILREEWTPQMRGVVHCFTGSAQQARIYTDEFGLFLGIGGVLTFPNAGELRDATRAVGSAKLVLETDCPYLAPVPMRGKRNEPAFVAHTARRLALELSMPFEELLAVTDANAATLFGI